MGRIVKDGGLGQFIHNRTPTDIDKQTVIRMNRDTLYSSAVFDLDAGPVTITMPDADKRFMSLQVINEDHYVPMVAYKSGPVTLTREKVGTRYVTAAVRTLVDPNDSKDLTEVHALQDATKISLAAPGKFEAPNWDPASQKKVRDALLVLSSTTSGFANAFGTKEQVDPVRHLIATAAGWGGNPDRDATYLSFTPDKNDGNTIYKLVVKDVPVDGFWSISLYNAEGYFQKNDLNAYSLNNLTATKAADGSVAVQSAAGELNAKARPMRKHRQEQATKKNVGRQVDETGRLQGGVRLASVRKSGRLRAFDQDGCNLFGLV